MRVGVLTTSFPRSPSDFAGSFVLGMARALAARGHEIEVLAPEPACGRPWAPDPRIALRWVPYLRPRALERTFYGAGAPENLAADPLAWAGVLPFAAFLGAIAARCAARWDAVVSHWLLPCGLVGAAVRRGRPHLAVCHSADIHLLGRLPARGLLASALLRGSTALLFASGDARDRFARLLSPAGRAALTAHGHVGAMGIDGPAPRSRLERARLRRARGLDGFVLLVLSRLVPVKGVADLAGAVGGERGITVLVAGEGPEREAIRSAFAARRARVEMLGAVSAEAKRDALAVADALVLPSRVLPGGRTEGAPTAALEAMAAGLPVIATRVGGVPSIVPHDRVGLLVPAGDPAALRAAILALRDDPSRRRALARRAATHARRYLWPAIAPRIEELLGIAGGAT